MKTGAHTSTVPCSWFTGMPLSGHANPPSAPLGSASRYSVHGAAARRPLLPSAWCDRAEHVALRVQSHAALPVSPMQARERQRLERRHARGSMGERTGALASVSLGLSSSLRGALAGGRAVSAADPVCDAQAVASSAMGAACVPTRVPGGFGPQAEARFRSPPGFRMATSCLRPRSSPAQRGSSGGGSGGGGGSKA